VSQWLLFAVSGVVVLAVGLHGLFRAPELIRRIIAANLAGSGVFLVMVALARRSPDGTPDPVPQALVLTGIVVSVSATACALALAQRLSRLEHGAAPESRAGADEPGSMRPREPERK
jgi:multicomponent Na+:H+ antiporter subunit C